MESTSSPVIFNPPDINNQPKCDRIIIYDNNTAVVPGYEGIPQNLLINSVSLLVLLILFTYLRKNAWDYGRLALTRPHKNKWASLFYASLQTESNIDDVSHESMDGQYNVHDYGYLSWIRTCFTLKDADIERKAGIDAVHYLRFHLYLICFTVVVMVGSITIILPLNIKGDLKSVDLQSFGVTTISNIAGNSPMLWGHLMLGVSFFCLAFVLMQFFSKQLWKDRIPGQTNSQRTLMISGISRSHCQSSLIKQHFYESFQNVEVEDIQVCYDVRNLIHLDAKREAAKFSAEICQQHFEAENKRPTMVPRCCGQCCNVCYVSNFCRCCFAPPPTNDDDDQSTCYCLCPTPVDAIDCYTNEYEKLSLQINEEAKKAVRNKIGIAFVTFKTLEGANSVYHSYHRLGCMEFAPVSSLSIQLRSSSWTVQFAPMPDNIIWSNLSLKRTVWWLRAFAVNSCVFLVVFFLTTPTYVLNLINEHQLPKRLRIDNSIITQFLPSIILWLVSTLLPLLVYNSDRLVGHWTRSNQHLIVMAKTFCLLILMVLILPSLGLTSISAIFQWLIPKGNSTVSPNTTVESDSWVPNKFQWECVFMPDNGAFFVNYVITSAFIGNAMQLVRLPELICYACRLMCVRSPVEKYTVRKDIQYEFDFGLSYAWNLCLFSVISAYSILCPLITPFGLIWLVGRYLVDRYNLFFAYLPSRIDSRIHWLAMNFMLFAVLLLQLNLFMFILIRFTAARPALSVGALVVLVFCLILWLTNIITGWIFVGSRRSQTILQSTRTESGSGRWDSVQNVPQPATSNVDAEIIPVVDTQFYSSTRAVAQSDYQYTNVPHDLQSEQRFIAPILHDLVERSALIQQ